MVLEYIELPEVSTMKSVRLCHQTVLGLRNVFHRLVLFKLSELNDISSEPTSIITFMNKMMYWQNILLSPENTDGDFTRLLCYLLYTKLVDERESIRLTAANVRSQYLNSFI